MKKWTILLVTLLFTGMIFWSCSGEDDNGTAPEPENIVPTCEITSPASNTAYNSGNVVLVEVNAEDADGEIVQVCFYLNGLVVDSIQASPYNFDIPTSDLTIGEHIIRVVAEDNNGAEAEVELPFTTKLQSPSDLQVIQNNVCTFTLSWTNNNPGADGSKIERKIDDGVYTEIGTTIVASFVDSTIAKKGYGTVYYQIRAYKGIYYSDYSIQSHSVTFPPPTDLIYSQININTIKLDWLETSNGEAGFKIDKKIGVADWVLGYATVGENMKTYTDANAEINQDLQYRVYAYNGSNMTIFVTSATIDNTFPAPTNLTYTKITPITIRLDWLDNSDGEVGFKIDKKIDPAIGFQSYGSVGANIVTYTDVNAEINQPIQYRVYAYKDSDTSELITTSTISNTFPPPTNLTYTKINPNTIRLDWLKTSIGEDGFKIEKKVDTEDWVLEYGSVGMDIVTYTDVNAEINQNIQYRVYAYKGSNMTTSVTSATIDNTFPPPTNLTYAKINPNTIKLDWFKTSIGEDGFKIDKKVDTEDWVLEYGSVGMDIVTYTDVDAEINQNIQYRVYAYKGPNMTSYATSTIIDNAFPPPTNLITIQTSITSTEISWTDNSIGEDKFEIERKLSTETTYIKIAEVVGSDTSTKSCTDLGLTPNLTYNYKIRAVKGSFSSIWVGNDFINIFPKPTNLTYSMLNPTSIKLNWLDNSIGEDGFIIDRKSGSNDWVSNYSIVTANITSLIDENRDSLEVYSYKIRGYSTPDYSDYSDEIVTYTTFEDMIYVPSGSFYMGQIDVAEPVHLVTLTNEFYIGKFEITNIEYCDMLNYANSNSLITNSGGIHNTVGETHILLDFNDVDCEITYNGSSFEPKSGDGNKPVGEVTWFGAAFYCNMLSKQKGFVELYDMNDWTCNHYGLRGFRLPTEAEWEYVARFDDSRTYPWGDSSPSSLNCNYDNEIRHTVDVGSYTPTGDSKLGLCDLAGNVTEWCNGLLLNYSSNEQTNPIFQYTYGGNQIYRGGTFMQDSTLIKAAFRLGYHADTSFDSRGFRIIEIH